MNDFNELIQKVMVEAIKPLGAAELKKLMEQPGFEKTITEIVEDSHDTTMSKAVQNVYDSRNFKQAVESVVGEMTISIS